MTKIACHDVCLSKSLLGRILNYYYINFNTRITLSAVLRHGKHGTRVDTAFGPVVMWWRGFGDVLGRAVQAMSALVARAIMLGFIVLF